MRFPILALASVLIAAPAMAEPAAAPDQTVSAPGNAMPVQSRLRDNAPQSAANETQAIFSEPTEPVPLLPSQRKLLRMRKV